MMARCKLNPCCGETMPGKCKPPPQFRAGESHAEYEARTTNDAPAPAPSGGGVRVKPLQWKNHAEGVLYRAADLYVIEDNGANWSHDRYWLFVAGPRRGKFATLDEAKAAAQADYEARILSALASDASPRGEAVAWDIQNSQKWCGQHIITNDPAIRDSWAATPERYEISIVPLYAHPAPATVEMRELAELRAFKSAVYELAGKRPDIRHHTEPAWNVDLFEVERRSALAPATEGRKG